MNHSITVHTVFSDAKLASFDLADESEVQQIIRSSPRTSCAIDPLPTWFLHSVLPPLIPCITKLVNLSLMVGMPNKYRHALVSPLLKKKGLDPESMINYRPVSQLSFLSKLIKRVVYRRLSKYLYDSSLCDPNQAAYRRHHSYESVVIHVCASALQWFSCYLSSRSQLVCINGVKSRPLPCILKSHKVPCSDLSYLQFISWALATLSKSLDSSTRCTQTMCSCIQRSFQLMLLKLLSVSKNVWSSYRAGCCLVILC